MSEEAKKGLITKIETQRELNEFEQVNTRLAAEWAHKNKKFKSELVSVYGIQLLHKKMFNETWGWAGKFNRHDSNIGTA